MTTDLHEALKRINALEGALLQQGWVKTPDGWRHLEAASAPETVWHYHIPSAMATACGLTKESPLHYVTVSPAETTCKACLEALPPAQETAPACSHPTKERWDVVGSDAQWCGQCGGISRFGSWSLPKGIPSTQQEVS